MELRKLNHEPEVSDLLNEANRWLILGPSEASLNDYLKLLNRHAAKCGICSSRERDGVRLRVDHAHNTTTLRGLLCTNCSMGLGYFKDSRDALLRANQYLKGNLTSIVCNEAYHELTPKRKAELQKQLSDVQDDKCLICNKLAQDVKHLCLGHCHNSNRIRGLLCNYCNAGLGQFKHNSVLLLRANLYLKR